MEGELADTLTIKLAFSYEGPTSSIGSTRADDGADGPRKRRSRWGDESSKVEVPGLPVALTGKVSQTELDNYAIHVRLEEINRKLRTGDVVPPERER